MRAGPAGAGCAGILNRTMVPTDDVDPPSALPRGTRLGEFEIRRVLGIGGFGIVYLAFDHALEREVAVKEYMPASLAGRTANMQVSLLSQAHAETFALGLRSFVNEARLLARFDHPSLVKVHRYWEQNATAYMAMPLYAGDNLHKVRQHMTQPPDEAWLRQLLDPLLGAIERLHEAAVFHRDISPDNVILQPDGRPVLLDFGAARRVIGDKSMALTAILKPAYAPIEQYAEAGTVKQGPWTDLYSLGATLHYLLLGRAPSPSTARAVQDDSVPLAMGQLAGCSPAFLRCIDWMLQPRPNDRPQSVAQLRQVLAGRAEVPDPSAGAWARTQRFVPDADATVVMPRPVSQPPGRPPVSEVDSTLLLVPAERPFTGPGPAPLVAGAGDAAAAVDAARPSETAATNPFAETRVLGALGASPMASRQPSSPMAEPLALAGHAEPDLAITADPVAPSGAGQRRPATGRWAALAAVGAAGVLAAWLGFRPASPDDVGNSARGDSPATAVSAIAPAEAASASVVAASGASAAQPEAGTATATQSAGEAPGATTSSAALPATAAAAAVKAAAGDDARDRDSSGKASAGQPAAAPGVKAAAQPAKPAAKPAPAVKDSPRDAVAALPAPAAVPFKLPPPSTSTIVNPTTTTTATAGHSTPAPPTNAVATSPAPTLPPMPAPAVTGPVAAVAEPVKPVVMATPAPPTPVATTTSNVPASPAPTATATPSPAPQRPAVREPDPMVHARALSPSERCEGRSLVTYNSCIEAQCRAADLRDHPECVKARREQDQRGGSRF